MHFKTRIFREYQVYIFVSVFVVKILLAFFALYMKAMLLSRP